MEILTELSKELRLFNLLINEKYSTDEKGEKFINGILETILNLSTKNFNEKNII